MTAAHFQQDESELAVAVSLWTRPRTREQILDALDPEWLTSPDIRILIEAIDEAPGADRLLLMRRFGEINGGPYDPGWFRMLESQTVSPSALPAHLARMRQAWQARELDHYLASWRADVQEGRVIGTLDAIPDALAILDGAERDDGVTLKTATEDALRAAIKAREGDEPPGLLTGFLPGLDDVTGGFQAGEVLLVMAKPKHGKSELALRLAKSFADQGRAGDYFSLEMPSEGIA